LTGSPPPARFFAKVFIRIEIVRHFRGKVLHQNGLTAKSWFIKRYGPDMVRRAIAFFLIYFYSRGLSETKLPTSGRIFSAGQVLAFVLFKG
jgi:hypothetical protein